jgi:hypothetical protein
MTRKHIDMRTTTKPARRPDGRCCREKKYIHGIPPKGTNDK